MENRLNREFSGIQSQFNNIISNIKHFKSDSTDIHDKGVHLSVSLDNRMLMNFPTQHVNSTVSAAPAAHAAPAAPRRQFGFNLISNKHVVKPKIIPKTNGPKVENLNTLNDRLKYILVTKNGEVISLHKNTKEDLDPSLEQKKADILKV